MTEYEQVHSEWQQTWQQMAKLKKQFQPNYAPIVLWQLLEEKCRAQFQRMLEIRRQQ